MKRIAATQMSPTRALRYAALCGLGGGLSSQLLLLFAANAEGKPLARPINATSHWLWGERDARRDDIDLAHTGVGLLTNQSAALFWGTLFGLHLASQPRHDARDIVREAALMGVIASLVDYGLMPKRLTPGWELALSRKSVALGMAATALGLGLGALVARASER